jgi:hypothetical protein
VTVAYNYVTVDGQRVPAELAVDWANLKRDFEAAFPGITLVIVSGTRTDAEQEQIFRERYVTAGNVRGRRVYDTRWWNGQLWYRISSAGTVAQPGTSNHQESGPNGPRSVDIRDTGGDAGVTRAGSRRDQWMQANAGRHHFENEGNAFNERWHKKWVGTFGQTGTPAGGGAPAASGRPNVKATLKSWNWNGIAAMLRATGRYRGNNVPGPIMFSAFQDFLNDSGYSQRAIGKVLKLDGDPGDETAKALQGWLKWKPWGYTGDIDAWLGDGSHKAWNAAEAANWQAFPGHR